MAVVRTRSSPPYALFTAVFLCVVFAGLAILFYMMYSKADEQSRNSQLTLDQVAGNNDVRTLRARSLLNEKNPAVRQLQGELDALRTMIAGANATKSAEELKNDADLKPVLDKYSSLQAGIKQLTVANGDLETGRKHAEEQATAAGKRAVAAEKQLADAAAADEQKIAQLQDQLNKAQQGIAAANQRADQTTAQGQTALNAARDSADQERVKLVLENEDLHNQVKDLTNQIAQFKLRIANSTHGTDTLVGESDGTIISVNAVANEVYISLTSKDRVRPGMTFTAYDQRLGVRYGTDDAAQGDGSIEVMEVGPDSSRCRITRVTKGHSIQVNDLIANVVYHNDKTRQTRFVIYGDFDLDGDGIATPAERDRLVSMILGWGGQVDNDVTAQTDYLVMGARPASPTVVIDTTAPAPAPGTITEQRSREQNRYDDLISSARSLSIPVLNANRFLSMIGYYNTTIVRY